MVVSTYPSEKYDFVSWDYEIANIWKNKVHVPNHQPAMVYDTYNYRELNCEWGL
jgi:hypothetical protein